MPDSLKRARGRLAALGAYGFEDQEPVILAALVTADPLLLVGRSGTGKTFLLNSISEALGLEHRHYNASLISFDDLVGFPYPDEERTTVRFLETPATIWHAESVLIDEISRCKPEHQNRLFSLVHERRIQGIPLARLQYRWAAMNPCTTEQTSGEEYLGSEPLDPALADRFGTILEVGDWDALSDGDRRLVADPRGEGLASDDHGRLAAELAAWKEAFDARIACCPLAIIDYVCVATTALREGGIRVSPRRARLPARALVATMVVEGVANDAVRDRRNERAFRRALEAGLPHLTWGERPPEDKIAAAHRLAWDASMLSGAEQWVHKFHVERSLERKAALLLGSCPDPDTGTLAIEQLIAHETPERAAAFALAAYPAAAAGRLAIGAEGIADLGRVAQPLLTVDGQVQWQERISQTGTTHPELAAYGAVLGRLKDARRERARQLFYYCAINKIAIPDARAFELAFDKCVRVFAEAEA